MKKFQFLIGSFLLGVVSLQCVELIPPSGLLVLLGVVAVLSVRHAAYLSAFLLGFVWVAVVAMHIQSGQLEKMLEGKALLLSGEVVGLPVKRQHVSSFEFKVIDGTESGKYIDVPERVKLSWYNADVSISAGEKWQLLVKLKRPHGTSNPHGFDYEKWLFQQRISATGYVKKNSQNKRLAKSGLLSVSAWREGIQRHLDERLVDSPYLPIIKALVIGDKRAISQQQWEVFRLTGTSHLIAISGLHIGLVGALVFGLLRWFILGINHVKHLALPVAVVTAMMAACGYAALAGFAIPTQRALIMLCVVLGGVFWQRHLTVYHAVSVALLIVLLIDPVSTFSPGFWMSFAAVIIIMAGTTRYKQGEQRTQNARFIRQLLKVQLLISVGLLPFVVFFFQEVSLISPIANIIAVPLVSFVIVPLLMTGLLLGLVSRFAEELVFNVLLIVFDFFWQYLDALASFSFSHLVLTNSTLWACFFALLGLVGLYVCKKIWMKLLSLILLIPLMLPVSAKDIDVNTFQLTMLDVGQGLSVVVRTRNHSLVFDTGAKFNEQSDYASTVILPYLRGEGVETIDALVISHSDNDHAGGINTLLENIPISSVMTSVPNTLSAVKAERCVAGKKWVWDGVLFEFIHPSKYKIFEGNDASCVLRIDSPIGSALLPGDIEKNAENSLLRYHRNQLKADVLIAPHHGSLTSSTNNFIAAVSPDVVLFPVGYRNRFGFPKFNVVERYNEAGVTQYDSARHGALSVHFEHLGQISVMSHRQQSKNYWSWVE